jgi:4-amino-4-deoxychorismate lyase
VVLERMREGGLVGVLDGMRQDREAILAGRPLSTPRANKSNE